METNIQNDEPQSNVYHNDNSNSNFERVEIENSPFVGLYNETGWRILIGDKLMTDEVFTTFEDLKEFVDTKPWKLIMRAAFIFTNEMMQAMAISNEQHEKNKQK